MKNPIGTSCIRTAAVLMGVVSSFSWSAPRAAGDEFREQVVERLYATIDADTTLSDGAKSQRKLEIFKASLEMNQACVSAVEDLSFYSRLARETGTLLQPGFERQLRGLNQKLASFESQVGELAGTSAFKGLQRIGQGATVAREVVQAVREVDAILSDPNLPPSSRKTLLALRTTGAALASFGGKIPLVGVPLELYGEMINELTGAVRKVARDVRTIKADGFSGKEETEQLAGLPTPKIDYVRTDLWDLGLEVVVDRYWSQEEESTTCWVKTAAGWRSAPLQEVSQIVAEYRMLNKGFFGDAENPSPEQIMEYL